MEPQETEGLLSPLIRDIRLKKVASYIKEHSTVLDVACGSGYMSKFLPLGCKYYGVDKILASTTKNSTDFIALDLLDDGSLALLREWLPQKPDYITCIAFLEHITNPAEFVSRYRMLLTKNGKLIGTSPHPRGRLIHESLARVHLCSRHGAEEHKDFLRKEDIEEIALTSGGRLSIYEQFLVGLNQLFVIEYP